MSRYYPTCDDTANDLYSYYHHAFEEEDNRDYGNSCHCFECCVNSYNTNSTGCYYSDCANSGNFGANRYDLRDYMSNPSYRARRDYLGVDNREAQAERASCSCANHDVLSNYSVDSYLLGGRQHNYRTKNLRRCNTYCHYDKENQTCHIMPVTSTIPTQELSRIPHNYHVGFTRPESPMIPVSSGSLPRESFHSCLPCNSSQVQMVYENQAHLSSKSTINQSSMQTLDSKASRGILRKKPLQKQQKINSGYFEIVSPTHTQNSSIESANVNFCGQKTASGVATPEVSKKAIHYGYFEVKERNYVSTDHIRKISLAELDNVPIKISKEVDTANLKQSIMLDKSLSANIPQPRAKTSDKALLVNITPSSGHPLTHADIVKIINSISKNQMLQVKKSDKMVQSISNKSLTNFKPPVTVKTSHGKTKRSFHKPKTALKAVRSISEGSIHLSRKAPSKHSTHRSQDNANVKSYKGYLDAALNKLEDQITNKFKSVLLNYTEAADKRRSVVTIYNSATKCATEKKEIGTTPSPTMQTEDDVIDSEEVEIGSTAYDEKSSLSSDVQTVEHNNCNHTSDVSSYNTEKTKRFECLEGDEKMAGVTHGSSMNSQEENSYASALKEGSDELKILSESQNDQYVYHSQTYHDSSNMNTRKMDHSSNRSLAPLYRTSHGGGVYSSDKSLAMQGFECCDKSNCKNRAKRGFGNTARRISQEFLNTVTRNDGGSAGSGRCKGPCPDFRARNELSRDALQKATAGSTHSFERAILSEIIGRSVPISRTSLKSFSHANENAIEEHYHYDDEDELRKRYSSTSKHDTDRQRERSIKFGSPQLCTISEEDYEYPHESPSELKLLHKGEDSFPNSYRFHPEISSKTEWERSYSDAPSARHPHSLTSTSPFPNYSWNPTTESKCGTCPPPMRVVGVCNPPRHNELIDTCVEETVDEEEAQRLEDFIYMDHRMKQTSDDCPRKRYYAKFPRQHDGRRKSDEKHYERQCDCLFYDENRRCYNHGKTNAMNIVSFVVFIVMFYGIFQYIDVGVRTGKFPWI